MGSSKRVSRMMRSCITARLLQRLSQISFASADSMNSKQLFNVAFSQTENWIPAHLNTQTSTGNTFINVHLHVHIVIPHILMCVFLYFYI